MFTLYVISWMSGWHDLAQRFKANSKIVDKITCRGYASMRWGTSYSGVLCIGGNYEGLRIATWIFFRSGHPPLFIPWKEISIQQSPWYAFYFRVTLTLGKTGQIPFRITKRTARKLRTVAGPSWPDSMNSAQL
jgi:hypothetical protein